MKIIATNKKAYHNYFIEDTYTAGIALEGSEVKSARCGGVSLNDGFAYVKDGEIFLGNVYVAPYEKSSSYSPDPRRTRKLLLNGSEILKITAELKQKGYTLVPIKIYFLGEFVKVDIALCRGKKLYDKRAALHEKDIARDTERQLKRITRA